MVEAPGTVEDEALISSFESVRSVAFTVASEAFLLWKDTMNAWRAIAPYVMGSILALSLFGMVCTWFYVGARNIRSRIKKDV